MRTLSAILLCLLFLTFSPVRGQETFAPLISENCVAFVHVDFSKADIDTVKGTVQKFGADILRELYFDDRSLEATMRELNVELEKLDMLARPVYDTITKELGIKELAVIIDMDIIAMNRGAGVIAIPWKNKTTEQFETLKKLFLSSMPDNPEIVEYVIPVGDYLLLPIGEEPSNTAATVKGWLAKKVPSPAILEALKNVEGNEIKLAVALPETLRATIKNAPLPPDVPVQVRNLLSFAVQKIQWASASLSLRDLFGGEEPENADAILTVKTNKRSDAAMFRSMMEQLIEFGVTAAQFQAQQQGNNQVPPLAFQFGKGLLRTLLPDVEEDKLVFRAKGKNAASKQVLVSAAGLSAVMGIPAVQAAREAARKMQCMNNMKILVLAIHNFHDKHGKLPPLYTVDKNGKPLHSWRVLLLPYLEQSALYNQIRLDEPWDSEYNKQFHSRTIELYHCPSNPNPRGMSNYSAIAGEGFVPAKKAGAISSDEDFSRLQDGTSNTIAFIEVKEPFCWMDPTADITLDELTKGINKGGRCGSYHPHGCNVGMFDGSIHFASEGMHPNNLREMGDYNDGKGGSW